MGWRQFRLWMAQAELDGWDDQGELVRTAVAHFKATIHNELLPLLSANGVQVSQQDVRTPQDYLVGGKQVRRQTDQEIDAQLNRICGH